MKKHILAVSVAAALGAVGGTAFAAPILKANGIGHVNIVPYFNAQGSNVTQFHIINTDTGMGKAVKVRARGAEWSDDLFDFTVFLSPGDIFVGAIRANTTTGGTEFVYGTPADGSCTLPASLTGDSAQFSTVRLGSSGQAGTREGYMEIINMADIVDIPGTTTDLFDAIKHVNGVAPCKTAGSAAANLLAALMEDAGGVGGTAAPNTSHQTASMGNPTGTLTTWSRIIDVANVKAFGNSATAIAFQAGGANSAQKAYFRQANASRTPNVTMTADGIFFDTSTASHVMRSLATNPITAMYQYDMPDLSTPIDTSTGTAVAHRNAVAALLQKSAILSEFVVASDVAGATDLVINQPMRRYYYTYQSPDATQSAQAEGTGWSRLINGTKYRITGDSAAAVMTTPAAGDAGTPYTALTLGNAISIANLGAALVPLAFDGPAMFMDRDESYTTNQIVISPTPPVDGVSLKGEVSVLSLGLATTATESVAQNGKLTWANLSVPGGYTRGWVTLSTTAKAHASIATGGAVDRRLPIIGYTALRVAGTQQYGNGVPFRYFGATGSIGH